MAFDKMKKGKILVEIKVLNTERILNLFWKKNIRVYKVKKKDFATLILEIDYLSYLEVKECVEKEAIISHWWGYVFMHYILFIYLHMGRRSRCSTKYTSI